MPAKKIKFEEALKKLEQITEEIERGEIDLEASISKYEEGMKLVAQCRQMLADAEVRIQKLSPTPSGELDVTVAPDAGEQ
jgi:exodeoxyribonuclease VII small subunit